MSISPSGIHDEDPMVFAYCFGKSFGAGLNDNVPPTNFTRQRCVQWWTCLIFSVLKVWNDDVVFQARLALWKKIRQCKCFRVGRLTVCPLMELPFTAKSPKYPNSFCARFWV